MEKLAFIARPKQLVDKKIKTILKLLKINDVPIVHLKDNLYFIGIYKMIVEMQGDFLMIKVGNKKYERFADYLKTNQERFVKFLTLLSLKNEQMEIVAVVNSLIMSEYMKGIQNSYMTNMSFSRYSAVSNRSLRNSPD